LKLALKLAFGSIVVGALAQARFAGCSSQQPLEDYDPAWPEAEAVAATGGAIYQEGREVALFENATARHVGDIVTIRLVERTNASKSSSTSTSKQT
jgi:flagellar L-ring protein precursor FlgH